MPEPDPPAGCEESGSDPFARIAAEFLRDRDQGGTPSVEEYARRYPAHADQIRELFGVLGDLDSECARERGDELPARFGPYRTLRAVGHGGMGVVYEALDESLGRRVALRVLPHHASLSETSVQRFRREAQAAARLRHDHIVPVFGVGEADGTLDLAIESMQRGAFAGRPASSKPGSSCSARRWSSTVGWPPSTPRTNVRARTARRRW